MATTGLATDSHALPFLTFRLGAQRYALAIDRVVEVAAMVELTTVADAPPELIGVANRHGSVLPMLDLRRVFHHDTVEIDDTTLFVVVDDNGRQVGLVVDEVFQVAYFDSAQIASSPLSEKHIESIITHRDHLIQIIALPALLASFVPQGAAGRGYAESERTP